MVYGLRTYTWHYYRVYIDVQALQVSLLAGRIFFKNVRYHGKNETIVVHEGYVTWQYWLRHVQELGCRKSHRRRRPSATKAVSSSDNGTNDDGVHVSRQAANEEDVAEKKVKELPCRVVVKAKGMEWFVYNRSPAYDVIMQSMREGDRSDRANSSFTSRSDIESSKLSTGPSGPILNDHKSPHMDEKGSEIDDTCENGDLSRASSSSSSQSQHLNSAALPGFLDLLPIGVECRKGAMVMGNRNTRSILTAKFDSAAGVINAKPPRASLDQYKQTFEFEFKHPVVEFKHNKDFVEPQISEGETLHFERKKGQKADAQQYGLLKHRTQACRAWTSFRDTVFHRRGSVESFTRPRSRSAGGHNLTEDVAGASGQKRWLGLTRYLDESDDLVEQEIWKGVEYGQFATIVDSPSIAMNFYWDVPGPVPGITNSGSKIPTRGYAADINGDVPPEWGIDLKVGGGTINYGPWADRQRADLQAMFFPTLCKDASRAARLVTGQLRVSTVMKIVVEMEAQATLRVPTREESKDWRWKGHEMLSTTAGSNAREMKQHNKRHKGKKKPSQYPEVRPPGWLDIRVLPDSTISFTMDLVAGSKGYENQVKLDLKGLEISSSVNHGLLCRSESQSITCDLSNPLRWNSLRKWHIDIHDIGMELFILRDHIFLLTDLVSDWTSGPPGGFFTFVPFEYSVALRLANFKLYLNANDSNIVNNPSDLDDNTFVVVWGDALKAALTIPSNVFCPARSAVQFDVEANDGGFDLRTPPRNTQHTFLNNSDVASLKDLRINGSYDYSTSTSTSLTDILTVDVYGHSPRIDLHGFMIRYLMKIKDNYFGDDIHFRTLEEYQTQISRAENQGPGDGAFAQHSRLSNDLDVILGVRAEKCCALLPAHLYSTNENTRLEILSVSGDLRITNYYMDLVVSSSPIAVSHTTNLTHSQDGPERSEDYSSTQVFIDGLEVFGHRLFGLPPTEPTYVCNWDFDVGTISGECSVEFLRCFAMSLRCFGLTFNDAENALPPLNPLSIHDVTFLRASIRPISIGLHVGEAAFLLGTGGIELLFNDWVGASFSDRFHVLIPDLTLAVAEGRVNSMDRSLPQNVVKTHAYLKITIALKGVSRKHDFEIDRQLQQSHITLHDARTCRVPWLIHESEQAGSSDAFFRPANISKSRPPAMVFPLMPEPVTAAYRRDADQRSCNSASAKSNSLKSITSGGSSFLLNASSKQFNASGRGSIQDVNSHQEQRPHSRSTKGSGDPTTPLKGATNTSQGTTVAKGVFEQRQARSVDFARPGLSFSSPYKRPHFPLLTLELDLRDVPCPPNHLAVDPPYVDAGPSVNEEFRTSDRVDGQSSLMLNLDDGVRVFCTPEALFLFTQVLSEVQTNDAVTLLDNLQIDTMTDVLDVKEQQGKTSRINDVRLYVPCMAVSFVNTCKDDIVGTPRQERYDLILNNLTATAMLSRRAPTVSSKKVTQASIHIALDRMDCSAKESTQGKMEDQALIGLSLDDIVLWMWHGGSTSAELQFEKLEILSASRKIDYISSLVRQTLLLSEQLASRFEKLAKERKSRIRLLVLLLMTEGIHVPDPPFLTRASHVLRSTSHDVRTSDSWKMMSRLRYIYQSLSASSRDKVHAQCIHKLASCPQDAASMVLASFKDSAMWSPTSVRSSPLMQKVYGELMDPPATQIVATVPLKASVKAGEIQIIVEPGPTQNEVSIKGLIVGLAMNQTSPHNGSSSSELSGASRSTVQVHCVELAIRLNWALLGLLENVVQIIQTTSASRLGENSAIPKPKAQSASNRLHIVVSSEMSILNCDTPNLKVVSLGQGMKTSLVIQGGDGVHHGSTMSVIFEAEAATSEIKAHSELLTLYKLRRLIILGSKTSTPDKDDEVTWKVVGTGEDVLFQVLANPLQIVEAADCFLEHEVAHLSTWTKSLKLAPDPGPSSPATHKRPESLKIQISLSLETYLISVGLLPSLIYQICGTGAGTSVKSGLRGPHDLSIEFTLKDHSHVFKTKEQRIEALNVLSTLQMPPINGRLSLNLAPEQQVIECYVLVEDIVFDASAVHAILTAVNRPEIVGFGNSISREMSLFQKHYNDIFGIEESERIHRSPKSTLYKANMTMASLAVQARTSESLSIAQGAELQFKMDRMQLRATNQDPSLGIVIEYPEFEFQIKGIDLHLLRYDNLGLLPCGNVAVKALLRSGSKVNDAGELVRYYRLRSKSLQINVYAETAPVVVAILGHLQDTLRSVDFSQEVQNLRKLGRIKSRKEIPSRSGTGGEGKPDISPPNLLNAIYSLEMTDVCAIWRVESSTPVSPGRELENLILSITKIDLSTKKDNAAHLLVENLQLQMVPLSQISTVRSSNSALLPEIVFNVAYVSTAQDRRLAFQAAGKSLDLQLTSQFILPASDLRRSIAHSIGKVRATTANWKASDTVNDGQAKRLLGNKRLASLLIDADFAGAVVHVQGRSVGDSQSLASNVLEGRHVPKHGRYNQFTPDNATNGSTTLRAPGIALKVEYRNAGIDEKSLNAEMKVDASSNTLYPTVVPLILEISSSIKDMVGEPNEGEQPTAKSTLPQSKLLDDDRIYGDPSAIFGNCRLNLGLRICRQEFSLSCQPIARVAATARFDDIYITVNTVQSPDQGKFFSISAAFKSLQASVQHVYSRESTGNFEVESIVVSLMNSKHLSAANGISAILNVSPMKAQVNGKQSQDFLLFREIWVPPDIRRSTPVATSIPASESQAFIVQRYQQIAATGAFPWNATVSIAELDVQVDLGQSLGKSAFRINKFWVSTRKASDWEQNLCLGFNNMAVDSTGRMSGFVELQNLKMRTSIQWPAAEKAHNQTPLVQASLAFDHLRVKAAFDYQAFAIADITHFEFLMYNVRDLDNVGRDRLVGVLDGEKVQVFGTTTSSSQVLALYQAFQRLYQEKVAAYETSLRDIEKLLRRKSTTNPSAMKSAAKHQEEQGVKAIEYSLKLQTDVMVTLKAVNIGAFPSTFFDNQIFKLEALDASARFAVVLDRDRIHSTLGMTLGQLRIALAGITRAGVPKTLGEVSVADVVNAATGSRGGTILKVPRLVASMETWQSPASTQIDYIFKSSFQGKVDVGWNYSRISYIRGMWATHARALAQRLGKPLPPSAVQITGGPRPVGEDSGETQPEAKKGKITAVVNVPQSKYQYAALRPPVIETPQLRDMGEATPPLEWIGLNREKLPNLTHQIVIVSLLEIAKEVDDAYSRILGSS